MNINFFEMVAVKAGFVAFALAMGLVACGDDGSTNGPSNGHNDSSASFVESEDDLPNCTESRDGSVSFVDGTKEGFVCKDRKWLHYDMIVDVDENLPGCTGSREGLTAYLYEENRELKCVEGVWGAVGEAAGSSSSVFPSSSSSVIPGTAPESGSSVASSSSAKSSSSVASSSSEKSSSSVASSSSAKSSSSVASSSSEKSSSSVASSSSAKSSSSVASSSSEKSSSSVASSSSAKSSSSVASSSSAKSSSSVADKANCAYLNPNIDYGTMTDTRDGQVYKTVTIGSQTWMAENLNYDPGNVSSMGSYAWSGCYNNESSNCSKYGRLYTWEVAMNDASCNYGTTCGASLNPTNPVRGVCPSGWHLPSHYEFEQLINFIDPTFGYSHTDDAYSSTAGQYLKSLSGWNSSGNGSDAYCFSALPGGFRNLDGYFYGAGYDAYFWSSGEYGSSNAFHLDLVLYYLNEGALLCWNDKSDARSVRCLKDSN
ncbi:fibrobacter succinogenes major paralogous domain-containing protein [Fibrobacter sp. HC4]|uniref:fibrobacter succinogenes major paralogous domain-containing protein n=1 Tax=Fibrobacter sp. HC4 TaxID=3239812 RepID=UPI002019B2A9|nr:fibrobacter succinogenes major paralogous domain-containing protein [Fibrobacter succinogenes]MCL4102134.1 hypothetical protein [Fibrobacter succinogenes]